MSSDDFKEASASFVGIGAPRSGSTWIYECLKEHPDICMSDPKETNFFMAEDLEDCAQYALNFPHCCDEKIKGEFSPRYLYSETAAHNIHRFLPDAKLLVCLRNPIDRIESRIQYDKAKGTSKLRGNVWDFVEKKSSLLNASRYHQHLQRFLSNFPREQIYIAIYADIQKDPVAFIRGIYTFLGVRDDFTPPSAQTKINKASDMRLASPAFQQAIRNIRTAVTQSTIWKYGGPTLKALGARKLHNSLALVNQHIGKMMRKPSPRMKFTNEQRAKIRSLLDDDIKALEELTGRSLDFWR